jgi:hypothetical protein
LPSTIKVFVHASIVALEARKLLKVAILDNVAGRVFRVGVDVVRLLSGGVTVIRYSALRATLRSLFRACERQRNEHHDGEAHQHVEQHVRKRNKRSVIAAIERAKFLNIGTQ